MWVRGLKLHRETGRAACHRSHPMWVRGLKLHRTWRRYLPQGVAPYVGAWIETVVRHMGVYKGRVAPYVGAWIETGVPKV